VDLPVPIAAVHHLPIYPPPSLPRVEATDLLAPATAATPVVVGSGSARNHHHCHSLSLGGGEERKEERRREEREGERKILEGEG
jgi:hypothetical protein